jgi:NTP pyrophosphatase (non-canonical NTP hydrolase)
MIFAEYQRAAARTSADSDDRQRDTLISAVGLVGEAGEVADLIKKHIGHGKRVDHVALAYELGDVLWYISDIATRYGLDLGQIAAQNIKKLRDRYPLGFTPNVDEVTQ